MKIQIPMHDFGKEHRLFGGRLPYKLEAFFLSGRYILGPNVSTFEKQFAAYIGTTYSVGTGNGLEALQIALLGLGVGKGDEVITVANSDIATALAVLQVGATPVFVDVDEYFHMDPQRIEQAVTRRTRAVLPVHLCGQVVDMDAIYKIATRHNLFILEDACQAHGATYHGRKAGSLGDAGCFSFYPTKNLGAAGDAGAITTKSASLYKKCAMLRNRGSRKRCIHPLRGVNSRLDEIQAVVLLHKLRRLDTLNRKRRRIADLYFSLLNDVSEVRLPTLREGSEHAFHLYMIRVPHRNALQEYLRRQGVETLIHYPIPIHKQRAFFEYRNVSLPLTERLAKEILSLPIHPFMAVSDIERVADLVKRFYRRTRVTRQ